MKIARLFTVATFLLACATANAFDFKSVGSVPTILYDSPSLHGIKRFIAPPGMPVEVVHTAHAWSKVRDVYGDMVWLETKALSDTRTVIVTADRATAYQQPAMDANRVFTVEKGVVLNLDGPVGSPWIKVRPQGGPAAYLQTSEIWGI